MSKFNYNEKVAHEEVKSAILKLLTDKAPNSVRIKRIYEKLDKHDEGQIDDAIEELQLNESIIKNIRKEKVNDIRYPAIASELERRDSISLTHYPEDMYIEGDYPIGNNHVVRLLSGDVVEGEDINEITEALKDYIDDINRTFDERIRNETSKIYKQMIGIFGVFVSIFAIIVISTEKMLRFSPETLSSGWFDLFFKSSALFLPVGLIVGGLVWFVVWSARK